MPSFWQVADAQEVRWACCLAAFASHTILHTWWRRHLLGSVDSGGDHLQHISRTGANTKSAANASVVDFHCMGPSSHLHAFRVQKRDEHSIQVLYICYYMWCFSMSFGTTFGSKGPAGTPMKSTRAERWWDFSPRKSAVIKTSQHIKYHQPATIHLGCPCHSCYGTHRHRGSQDAHRWTEAGRRGRGTRGARSTRGAAQATRGSRELQEDRCAHADHGAQRSRGTHPGGWSHADKSVEGTGESWAKKLRPEYDFQYSVQQMFMPNSNSNTLNTKICL